MCHGKKTNAILGALRRVPLVKRVVPKKERAPRTPPPPETSVEAAPEIAELIDAEADEAAKVLEAVVQQVVERGVAVPYETVEKPEEPKPEPAPEESQIERFDRLHASPLDRTDELLTQLRDASRDTNAVDVDVECWLENEGDTIQVPTIGWTRVQVDVTYTLWARAPGMRLASSKTVTFTREQFWEASRRLEEPPSSSKPVVVDLELLMEPATCELALDVNNDDCTLTLERPGLPDLSLERGSQVVEGLPAATVSTVVRASLKGHAQLKPLEPITLAAAQKHAVSVELRPASVLCKCVDARTGAELVNARVRYEADGTVQYGSRRAPVVVDPATYRGCVIVESVGDAYRILRDDGSTMVVDADRLRGSSPEWSNLEQGPPLNYVYEVNQNVWNGKRRGTIASTRIGKEDQSIDTGDQKLGCSCLSLLLATLPRPRSELSTK